ncbi:MAG: ABC transporter substrate-binding protein [Gammaproteobacteria bacterium]|nr:ABC transporter substrate-binding protein [Gammaproteobacteria bacterium]
MMNTTVSQFIKRVIPPLLSTVVMFTLFVMATSWSASVVADAQTIESPVALLERTSGEVLKILREDHELLQREPERVNKIINEFILPHLDDVTMAKLALGKNWRKATKQQKIAFVGEFKQLLIRTYSKSLIEFRDQTIRYFPLKLAPDAKKASVKAEVIQPGGPSIPMAYRMRIKNNAWKVYDIKIDGISLVTSYRGTFTQEIRKSGIDGLLIYLRDKNGNTRSVQQDKQGV